MYSSTDEGLYGGDWSSAFDELGTCGPCLKPVRRTLRTHPSSVGEYAATFSRREKDLPHTPSPTNAKMQKRETILPLLHFAF